MKQSHGPRKKLMKQSHGPRNKLMKQSHGPRKKLMKQSHGPRSKLMKQSHGPRSRLMKQPQFPKREAFIRSDTAIQYPIKLWQTQLLSTHLKTSKLSIWLKESISLGLSTGRKIVSVIGLTLCWAIKNNLISRINAARLSTSLWLKRML